MCLLNSELRLLEGESNDEGDPRAMSLDRDVFGAPCVQPEDPAQDVYHQLHGGYVVVVHENLVPWIELGFLDDLGVRSCDAGFTGSRARPKEDVW